MIQAIEIFHSIATLGTFAAAARRHGLPVMTISRRLASLEQDLGVRLFHRTTRSVSLTPEGEAYLPYAISLLETHNAGLAAMASGERGLQGKMKLTAPNLIGRRIIMPVLSTLMADNPGFKVDLTLTDGNMDLVGAGLDLAIRVSPLTTSELIATRLAANPRVLCAAPSYIESKGRPRFVADLMDHDCLTLNVIPSWPFKVGDEVSWVRVDGRLTANSIEALLEACLAGLGLAMLSYWDVEDRLANGELISITIEDADLPELGVWGVYPTRKQIPGRTRTVIDAIREDLERRPFVKF